MCWRYSEYNRSSSSYFVSNFILLEVLFFITEVLPQDFLTTKHSLDVESEQAYVVRSHYVIAPLASHFTCFLDGLLVAKLHQIII